MAKSVKMDPLEEVKLVSDPKKRISAPPPAPKKSRAATKAEKDDTWEDEPAPAPLPKAPAVDPNPPKRYRVKKSRMISWRGSLTTIAADSIISEHCYGGPEGIEALRRNGVELEEVS